MIIQSMTIEPTVEETVEVGGMVEEDSEVLESFPAIDQWEQGFNDGFEVEGFNNGSRQDMDEDGMERLGSQLTVEGNVKEEEEEGQGNMESSEQVFIDLTVEEEEAEEEVEKKRRGRRRGSSGGKVDEKWIRVRVRVSDGHGERR
jgi:hypothetical protein